MSYCVVSHRIVGYRIILYCIVLYCIVLYCTVLSSIVLYCIVSHHIVSYCIVLCCIVLPCYCIVLCYIDVCLCISFSTDALKLFPCRLLPGGCTMRVVRRYRTFRAYSGTSRSTCPAERLGVIPNCLTPNSRGGPCSPTWLLISPVSDNIVP